jgi:hypothetical protein
LRHFGNTVARTAVADPSGLDALLSFVKFRGAESSAGGADPLSSQFHTVPVTDRNGDQLLVYEIVERSRLFGLIRRRRFALCTGERVQRIDQSTFVIIGTGERLTRV